MRYTCPHCGTLLDIPDKYMGQKGRCRNCGQILSVPSIPAPSLPSSTGTETPRMPASNGVNETLWVYGGELIATKDILWVDRLAFSRSGRTLLYVRNMDGLQVHLLSVPDLGPLKTLGEKRGFFDGREITSVCFDPTGRLIAAACSDKTIRIWDVASGELVATLQGRMDIKSVDFSPDGKYVLSVSHKRKHALWEVDSANEVPLSNRLAVADDVNFISFSPDGRFIATWTERFLKPEFKLWDASSGLLLKQIPLRTGTVKYFGFSPTMNVIAIGSEFSLILYDIDSESQLAEFKRQDMFYCVLYRGFSTDGKILALAQWDPGNPSSGGLHFYAIPSCTEIGVLQGGWAATSPAFFISARTVLFGHPWLIHVVDVLSQEVLVRFFHKPWDNYDCFDHGCFSHPADMTIQFNKITSRHRTGMAYHSKGFLATYGGRGITLWGPGHRRQIACGEFLGRFEDLQWTSNGVTVSLPTAPETAPPPDTRVRHGLLTRNIGIETLGGIFHVLLRCGLSVPCHYKGIFSTASDNQGHIEVKVFEGSGPLVSACRKLGTFSVSGFSSPKRGEPRIEVEFAVSADGEFTCVARDIGQGKPIRIERKD